MYGIPYCVPEYFREQQERFDRECELELERNEWYKKNKAYQDQKEKNGFVVLQFPPDECDHCNYKEDAMPTSEYDDFPTIICNNCNWKECKALRINMKEKYPTVEVDEVLSWLDGKEKTND